MMLLLFFSQMFSHSFCGLMSPIDYSYMWPLMDYK